jgi:hypothetical protein
MSDFLQTPTHAATHAAALADASRWAPDDDVALGCECADPALQIERWAQEMQSSTAEPH